MRNRLLCYIYARYTHPGHTHTHMFAGYISQRVTVACQPRKGINLGPYDPAPRKETPPFLVHDHSVA